MIEGVIDFLLSETPEAQYIRNAAVVKIVPMVNVDGVIVGNYRYIYSQTKVLFIRSGSK